MSWFWRNSGDKTIVRYSIGEKIRYYTKQLKSEDPKKRIWAIKSLNRLNKELSKFGNVFMVRDNEFNPHASSLKPRQVVGISQKDNRLIVIPVRKNHNMVQLSNFDYQRSLNLNHSKSIPLTRVYENRTFKNISNSKLTTKEKMDLNKKLKNRQ